MNDYYSSLKSKLINSYCKKNVSINNLKELHKKLDELVDKFQTPNEKEKVKAILKDRLIDQYEEQKEDITFGVLIEFINNSYFVSMMIFDKEYTYSNLLKKEKKTLKDAKQYFEKLKTIIINNNLNSLSLYLLDNVKF